MSTAEYQIGWKWRSAREGALSESHPSSPDLATLGTRLRALYEPVTEEVLA